MECQEFDRRSSILTLREARKQYQKTAKKLARIGLMTELDDMALSMLCQGWQEYLEATEQVRKSGIPVKSPNGFPVLISG